MTFTDTLKNAAIKAWYDTVMPLASEEQRRTRPFKDYFLGAYLGLFAIIPTLINPLRRPPAFLLNFAAELLGKGREALEARDSTLGALALQVFEGLFRAAALLFRFFTSPVESFFVTWMRIKEGVPDNDYLARTLMFFNILLHLSAVVALFTPFVVIVMIPPFWIFLPIGGLGATCFTDVMEAERLGVLGVLMSGKPTDDCLSALLQSRVSGEASESSRALAPDMHHSPLSKAPKSVHTPVPAPSPFPFP